MRYRTCKELSYDIFLLILYTRPPIKRTFRAMLISVQYTFHHICGEINHRACLVYADVFFRGLKFFLREPVGRVGGFYECPICIAESIYLIEMRPM